MEPNEPDGEGPQPAVQEPPLTVDAALANAARLLHNADSWIAVARTIAERN